MIMMMMMMIMMMIIITIILIYPCVTYELKASLNVNVNLITNNKLIRTSELSISHSATFRCTLFLCDGVNGVKRNCRQQQNMK